MECLVQCLDDAEDLFYALALKWERIRGRLKLALFVTAACALQVGGVFLALSVPPVAAALVAVLAVGLLYRAAVYQSKGMPASP